jgi:molybdate transport system substrate-binding protein
MHLLSGGAAQGLVRALQDSFEHSSGVPLQTSFGAVGAMKQRLMDGAPCDVLILTRALTDELTRSGLLIPGSARDLGTVKTGIAVKAGGQHPPVHDADSLRVALRAASGIYFPDPLLATAGIHVMKVLTALGLAEELADRLRPYPNGNSAMKAMAECTDMGVIGSTQVTEILITPGVELVADLPKVFELATVYTAAVCTRASHPQAAQDLIAVLSGDAQAGLRAQGGFLPATI